MDLLWQVAEVPETLVQELGGRQYQAQLLRMMEGVRGEGGGRFWS